MMAIASFLILGSGKKIVGCQSRLATSIEIRATIIGYLKRGAKWNERF
jgi:hypothetical protein